MNKQNVEEETRTKFEVMLDKFEIGNFPNRRISNIFDAMEIAEEAIQWGISTYPERAEIIDCMFLNLGDEAKQFQKYGYWRELYRYHAFELIDRIGRKLPKKEIEMGTLAELVTAMCEVTLRTPINIDATLVYAVAFQKVLGDEYIQHIWEEEIEYYGSFSEFIKRHESYEGATEIEIQNALRTLSRDRNIPTEKQINERRQADIERGRNAPWLKNVQVTMNLGE